ncbi:hypothetical protein D3C86_1903150 [compost metagenome]
MNLEKLFVLVLALGLYLAVTIRLFFVAIPQMLREADSATNGFAVLAGFLWVVVTLYLALKWRQRKSKKGTK